MISDKERILDYIEKARGRNVYISELAEELLIDFDIIEEVMMEFKERPEGLYRIRTDIV
jgi:hypothetical protein